MNTANLSGAGSAARPAGGKPTRWALAWGFVCVSVAAALAFYVIEAVELSRRLGGFEGLEAARPAGYPGIRWFIVICALYSALIAGSAVQFVRAWKATRYDTKG
jgi:hypothetical protein